MNWLYKLLLFEDVPEGVVIDWIPKFPHCGTVSGVLLFLGAAAAVSVLAWFTYMRQEPDYVPPWKKRCLMAVRVCAFLLVLLVCTGVYIGLTRQVVSRGTVALLIDRSASMGIADRRTDPAEVGEAAAILGIDTNAITQQDRARIDAAPRLELAKAAFTRGAAPVLRRIGEQFDLKAFAFGRQAETAPVRLDMGAPDPMAEIGKADEQATRLGDALRDVARRLRGQHIAAIVAVTDGAVNRGEDPLKVAPDLPAPLFPVGVGIAGSKDVEVRFALIDNVIFKGDRFGVDVRIRQNGLADRGTKLIVRRDGDVVHTETVTLRSEPEWTHSVQLTADKAGVFTYEVELEPVPGEVTEKNNVRRRHGVKVIDRPLRVLLVDDKPRWEFRFLKTALESDKKRVRPECLLRAVDRRTAQQTPGMLLKFPDMADISRYDLVIIGNVPVDFFTRQELIGIEDYVRTEGGWLILIAGRRNMPASYAGTPIADLLPVEILSLASGPAPRASRSALSGVKPALTQAGGAFPLLRLDADEKESERLWRQIPPIFWFYETSRGKPNAEVLMEVRTHGEEQSLPLIVRQRYGAGQVLYVGTDETWRWRKLPGGEYHRKLWSQIVTQMGLDHMLGRESRVQIETDTREVPLGSAVSIVARVKGPDLKPLQADSIAAIAEDETGRQEKITLLPQEGHRGAFSAQWTPSAMGNLHLYLETFKSECDVAMSVVAPQIEFEEPGLREELLAKLAAAGGGRYIPLSKLDRLTEILSGLKPLVRTQRQERPLWNSPLILIAISLLFGLEWLLRKRWDML